MHVCTFNSSGVPALAMPARQRHGALAMVVALHAATLAWVLMREAPVPAPTAPVVVTLYTVPRATPTASAPAAEPRSRSLSKHAAAPTAPVTPAQSRRDAPPVLATEGAHAAATTPAHAASAPATAGTASAAGGGAATAAPAAPAPVTPPVFSADYLQNPAPAYPNLARRQGQQGRVVLRVLVNRSGLAEQLEVRASSGHALLDGAALDAVRRWRFVPARQGTEAVPAWVLIPLNFFLQG